MITPAPAMAISLLSGGLDSVVSTALARKYHQITLALTFDYGQRAATREIAAAQYYCELWEIPHRIVEAPWLAACTHTSLVNTDRSLPHYAAADLHDDTKQQQSASAVWVPNRNGAFINIAASFAESGCAGHIITGFNREEAATFPDNSAEFLGACNFALSFSTQNAVKVASYTIDMDKAAIVATARELNIPLEHCWPCYEGGDTHCGQCEACVRFARATQS